MFFSLSKVYRFTAAARNSVKSILPSPFVSSY